MKRHKKLTEYRLECECGAVAPVFQLSDSGYMAHCAGCGALTFFHNPVLLQRARLGGKLCPHVLERRPCKGGWTSWCGLCRLRVFYYSAPSQPAGGEGNATPQA